MSVVTDKRPADLTQEDVYDLFERYGGYADEKARSQLEHLLENMGYPEQQVGDVRAEVGDRLYFPAVRALEQLQARAATGAPENPPPEPRRPRDETVREVVAERATAGKQWRDLVERAKQPAEVKK